MSRTLLCLATFCLVTLLASGLSAQEGKKLEETGTVKEVDGPRFHMITTKTDAWWIQIVPGTKLHVTGTAEVGYLRQGLTVRFAGEFDKKGALQGDIKEIEVFTPQGKNGLGIFLDSGADKPVRSAAAGAIYDIRGKIASMKDNEFTLNAGGKKLSGKLADDATVTVNVEDIKDVHDGDSVKIKGSYLDQYKPTFSAPGQATGEEVDIKLSKPLTGSKKKAPAKAAKAPKEKKDKKASIEQADDGLVVSDPFGVDNKDDKKDAKSNKKPRDNGGGD